MDVLEVCEQLTLKTGLNLKTNLYYQRIHLHNTEIYIQRFGDHEYEVRIDSIGLCLSSNFKELTTWLGAAIQALIRFKDSELNGLVYMNEKLKGTLHG